MDIQKSYEILKNVLALIFIIAAALLFLLGFYKSFALFGIFSIKKTQEELERSVKLRAVYFMFSAFSCFVGLEIYTVASQTEICLPFLLFFVFIFWFQYNQTLKFIKGVK